MFCNFAPRPDMRAHELLHCAIAPMPPHVASLITRELPDAAFRSPRGDLAWYVDAHITLDDGSQVSSPFALRIDRNGNASMQCRWNEQELMACAIASLVPNIEIIDVRPQRAA